MCLYCTVVVSLFGLKNTHIQWYPHFLVNGTTIVSENTPKMNQRHSSSKINYELNFAFTFRYFFFDFPLICHRYYYYCCCCWCECVCVCVCVFGTDNDEESYVFSQFKQPSLILIRIPSIVIPFCFCFSTIKHTHKMSWRNLTN